MKKVLATIFLFLVLILFPVTVNSTPYASNGSKPKLSEPKTNKATIEQMKIYTYSYITNIINNELIPDIIKYLDNQEINLYRTENDSMYIGAGIEDIIKMYHDNKKLLFMSVRIEVNQLEIILFMQIIEYDERSASIVPLLISKVIPLFKSN